MSALEPQVKQHPLLAQTWDLRVTALSLSGVYIHADMRSAAGSHCGCNA